MEKKPDVNPSELKALVGNEKRFRLPEQY